MPLEEFFEHENQRYPPSISENGHLNGGTKSDLLECIDPLSTPITKKPQYDTVIVNGMVMMNMLQRLLRRPSKTGWRSVSFLTLEILLNLLPDWMW